MKELIKELKETFNEIKNKYGISKAIIFIISILLIVVLIIGLQLGVFNKSNSQNISQEVNVKISNNSDSKKEKNYEVKKNNIKEDNKNSKLNTKEGKLYIEKIELSPKEFNRLPSYFYLELQNKSKMGIKDTEVYIDFGTASYLTIEVLPRSKSSYEIPFIEDDGKRFKFYFENRDDVYTPKSSDIKIDFAQIAPNESIYIYALLTHTHFKNVFINPKNGLSTKFTYNDYINKDKKDYFIWFITGLIILLLLISIISFIYKKKFNKK